MTRNAKHVNGKSNNDTTNIRAFPCRETIDFSRGRCLESVKLSVEEMARERRPWKRERGREWGGARTIRAVCNSIPTAPRPWQSRNHATHLLSALSARIYVAGVSLRRWSTCGKCCPGTGVRQQPPKDVFSPRDAGVEIRPEFQVRNDIFFFFLF